VRGVEENMARVGEAIEEDEKSQNNGSEELEPNDGGCHHDLNYADLLAISSNLKSVSELRVSGKRQRERDGHR
jgi:hypothetical protein